MMVIVENKSHYDIRVDWSPRFKFHINSIKEIPGARYNGATKKWSAPITSKEQVELLRKSCGARIIAADSVRPQEIGEIAELPDLTVEPNLKNIELRPYQGKGIARMVELRRCMNGDDPGLGKTIQTIATLDLIKEFPAVIICPATLKLNWFNEISKYSHLRHMILDDRVKTSWPRYHESGLVDVYITNFESLKKYFVKSLPAKGKRWKSDQIILRPEWEKIKTVAIDESHRLKDPTTIQTKLSLRLCYNKQNVFLLTGTPVVNKPIDLFPQLAIMGKLTFLEGSKVL